MNKQQLIAAFGPEKAKQILDLVSGKIDPESYSSVQTWCDQCYNRPSKSELIMSALDEVLDGFGVEVIRGDYVDRYHQDAQATYVNMGDTYSATIVHDSVTGRYIVTSWGDWFELNEKRRGLA